MFRCMFRRVLSFSHSKASLCLYLAILSGLSASVSGFFACAESEPKKISSETSSRPTNPWANPHLSPLPSLGEPQIFGSYNLGCILGAVEIDNPKLFETLNPSRRRVFGHPNMFKFLEWLGEQSGKLAIGDISMPAGGPMPTGHASHEVGLDVDVRYEILPDGPPMNREERNNHEALFLAEHRVVETREGRYELKSGLNKKLWAGENKVKLFNLLQKAAEYPDTQRIFVSPPIKLAICDEFRASQQEGAQFPAWIAKLRPYYGHDDHFHARLRCPENSGSKCEPQEEVPISKEDKTKVGCDGPDLNWWFDTNLKKARESGRGSFFAEQVQELKHPSPANPTPSWVKKLKNLPKACQDAIKSTN